MNPSTDDPGTRPVYGFVIPVFDEEASLPLLRDRIAPLLDQLDGSAEVLLVNDGSRDGSADLMNEISAADPRFKVIHLSRNFGHQVAITAGLDLSEADATIVMDADLQDPPEVVLLMAKKWREGFDIVYGVRDVREGETRFKEFTAASFYRIFNRMTDIDIPVDVGDFRLVDRSALEAFKRMGETNRYVRGMFSWVGFRQTGVHYRREARAAGVTKYPLKKMVKFATDGLLSFSSAPLRFSLNAGFLVSGLSLVFGAVSLVGKLVGGYSSPGYASLVVLISFLGGIQLVVLGVMGEYLARVHAEVKDRPLYFIRELRGFTRPDQTASPSSHSGRDNTAR